ncbi:MAG: tetratricopeptide repeat protein [Polyangiaceae bacterium]
MERQRRARGLLFVAALALAMSACGGPSDELAEKKLKEEGFSAITLARSKKGSWTFTATKDGMPCTGSISITGSESSGTTAISHACTPNTPPPPPEPVCGKETPEVCREKAERALKAKNGKEAAELLRVACDVGASGAACNDWGVAIDHGDGGLEQDAKRSAELFDKSCGLRYALACKNRALLHRRAKELDQAFAMLQTACDLGSEEGCYHLGWAQRRGDGTKKDDAKALEAFEKGCAKGHASSCGAKGLLVAQGHGAPKDVAAGEKLLVDACDKKAGEACANLGDLVADGSLGARDPGRALALYEKGCGFDFGWSCFDAGLAYDAGRGAPKSPEKAEEFYTKACGAGEAEGCRNSAINHRDGTGTGKDLVKARELFDQACTKGLAKACGERDRIPK